MWSFALSLNKWLWGTHLIHNSFILQLRLKLLILLTGLRGFYRNVGFEHFWHTSLKTCPMLVYLKLKVNVESLHRNWKKNYRCLILTLQFWPLKTNISLGFPRSKIVTWPDVFALQRLITFSYCVTELLLSHSLLLSLVLMFIRFTWYNVDFFFFSVSAWWTKVHGWVWAPLCIPWPRWCHHC